MQQDKQRRQKLVSELQQRAGTPEVLLFNELLELLYDESVTNLVAAGSENMLRYQAEAQAYQKLSKLLSRQSLQLQIKETN